MALCASREPPERVLQVWDVLGYSLAQLPTEEDINLVMVGAEITRRLVIQRKLPSGKPPLAAVIEGLCDTPQEARRAIKTLESYGANVEPMMEEVAAL